MQLAMGTENDMVSAPSLAECLLHPAQSWVSEFGCKCYVRMCTWVPGGAAC